MCGFRSFTCGAIPFLLFTLRVFCSALLFRPSVRVVLFALFCSRCSVSGICVAGVSFRFISSSSISPAFYAACSFRWHFCRRIPQRPLCRLPQRPLCRILSGVFSAPPQTTIRLPSVSSPFRHLPSCFPLPSVIRLPLADVPASLFLFGSCLAL